MSTTQRHPYLLLDSRGNEVLYSKMGKRLSKKLKNGNYSKTYETALSYGILPARPEWSKKVKKGKKATKAKPFSLTRKYPWSDPATKLAVQKLKQIEDQYNSLKVGGIPATKYALRVKAKDFVTLYRRFKLDPNAKFDVQEFVPSDVKYKYASCPTNTDQCADNLKYKLTTGEDCCRPANYLSTVSVMAKRKRKSAKKAGKRPCKSNQRRNAKTGRCRKVKKAATKKRVAKKAGAKKSCKKGQRRSRATGRCRKV